MAMKRQEKKLPFVELNSEGRRRRRRAGDRSNTILDTTTKQESILEVSIFV